MLYESRSFAAKRRIRITQSASRCCDRERVLKPTPQRGRGKDENELQHGTGRAQGRGEDAARALRSSTERTQWSGRRQGGECVRRVGGSGESGTEGPFRSEGRDGRRGR